MTKLHDAEQSGRAARLAVGSTYPASSWNAWALKLYVVRARRGIALGTGASAPRSSSSTSKHEGRG